LHNDAVYGEIMASRQTAYNEQLKARGYRRRNIWLDEDTLERIKALVGRYGRNQSEVIAEAVRRLHAQSKRSRS
jgi:hypothetical protein